MPSKEKVEHFLRNMPTVSGKDIPVLVSAIEGNADFLITGDKKDFGKLKKESSYSLKIADPSEFLDLMLPEILQNIEGCRL